jgi:phage/plasmid-associated DNA primase
LRAYIAQQAHRASIPADHGPSLAPRSGPAPDDGPIRLDDLFAAWRQWCEQHGRPIITSKQTFGLNLAAIVAGLYRRREAADVPFDDGIAPKGDKQ